MTVHRHTNDASHSRFYVFRHKTVDGVQTMEHLVGMVRGDNFYWAPGPFADATLLTEDAATQVARTASAQGKLYNEKFAYCVGKVFVEVDGHFEILVVN